jgi:hypothetical protein
VGRSAGQACLSFEVAFFRLNLNRLLLKNNEKWDDAAISARAEALFEEARQIWPRPGNNTMQDPNL